MYNFQPYMDVLCIHTYTDICMLRMARKYAFIMGNNFFSNLNYLFYKDKYFKINGYSQNFCQLGKLKTSQVCKIFLMHILEYIR